MEPVVFMPTTLAGHVAKHCNQVVNSLDENNIGGVYWYLTRVSLLRLFKAFFIVLWL